MKYTETGLSVELVKDENGKLVEFEWRDVVGFEGIYKVSNYGHVRTVKTGRLRKINPDTQTGYMKLTLSLPGSKLKCLSVHRMVAKAFLPNYDNLPEVNHKDLDKCNNIVTNLEWSTREDNYRHALDNGACGGSRNKKLTVDQVSKIRELRLKGFTQSKLAKKFGRSIITIQRVIHGKGAYSDI